MINSAPPRLKRQMNFLVEIDKLKNIERRCQVIPNGRQENSAEHSWHISIYALTLLGDIVHDNVELFKVVRMLLIHDIVEIDAGDTFAYDEHLRQQKAELEKTAAERIFGLLPREQAREFLELWLEFERGDTREAMFARGLDRIQPLLQNFANHGGSWKKHNIRPEQVLKRNECIADVSQELWDFVKALIAEAEQNGYFAEESSVDE